MTRIAKRERFNFWLDAELREGLRAIQARDGIPESEQVRRAIRLWLEQKGIRSKETRKTR
jgi:hypothetical protein